MYWPDRPKISSKWVYKISDKGDKSPGLRPASVSRPMSSSSSANMSSSGVADCSDSDIIDGGDSTGLGLCNLSIENRVKIIGDKERMFRQLSLFFSVEIYYVNWLHYVYFSWDFS